MALYAPVNYLDGLREYTCRVRSLQYNAGGESKRVQRWELYPIYGDTYQRRQFWWWLDGQW